MNLIALIFSQYFYLRQTIPLYIYVTYLFFRDTENSIINGIVKTALLAIVLGTSGAIIGCILGLPINDLLQFKWSYTSPITWGILFISYYYVLTQKEENPLTSFTLATLAVLGGGWLYEVPFFHPLGMFLSRGMFFYFNGQIICLMLLLCEWKNTGSRPNPLIYTALLLCMFLNRAPFWYPNVQIICLILLAYELKKRNFKPNRIIYATTILFIAFSTPLFLDMHGFWGFIKNALGSLDNLVWFYRIPASLFLLSLLSGVNENV